MCGAGILQGILCASCDRPRRVKLPSTEAAVHATSTSTAVAPAVEPFPKAPVVPFPLESVSPALTSVAHVLVAAGVPAVVLSPDRSVKFVTDELKKVVGVAHADLKEIEQAAGVRIGELSIPSSSTIHVRDRKVLFSLVPLSGGAGGAVLIFRTIEESHTSAHVPKITEVVQTVANRFTPFADLKNIRLQVSVSDSDDHFHDSDRLADALGVLMDNSLHYVPTGGQVVVGVRSMEHKGRPILLFFVMDNGPLVPEHLRHVIFESGFIWNPAAQERSGRNLSTVREFAVAHAGSVWVDSKTGRACTFFLRVSPDRPR